jgi:Zn-dependent protease
MRMLLVPPLGGVAISSRAGGNRFQTAFVALMGAGFSALLVPVSIAASMLAGAVGQPLAADLLAVFAGCAALFNLANLVPVGPFDGGQVLRHICPGPVLLGLASFVLFSVFLAAGWRAGCSAGFLFAAGAVFAGLSLLAARAATRPRRAPKPVRVFDRFAIGAGLLSVFVIHGCAVMWASDVLL